MYKIEKGKKRKIIKDVHVTFIDRDDNQIVVEMANKGGYTSVAINGKTVWRRTLSSPHHLKWQKRQNRLYR
ncbi:MAG: hypothetical protein PHX21_12955 [bacterium]|nr:hypothetical protein [bacterium]